MSRKAEKEQRSLNREERRWWNWVTRPLRDGETAEAEAQFLRVLDSVRREKLPKWSPFQQATTHTDASGADHMLDPGGPETWVNSRYQVAKYTQQVPGLGRVVHLSIKTHENDAHHDWRELQRIKNELVGPQFDAVEIYPAESRLVDTVNQYHLWVLLDGGVPFGFQERLVSDVSDGLSRQRKWEPEDRPADCREITPEELNRARQMEE